VYLSSSGGGSGGEVFLLFIMTDLHDGCQERRGEEGRGISMMMMMIGTKWRRPPHQGTTKQCQLRASSSSSSS